MALNVTPIATLIATFWLWRLDSIEKVVRFVAGPVNKNANAAPGEIPLKTKTAAKGVAPDAQTYVGIPKSAKIATSSNKLISPYSNEENTGFTTAAADKPNKIHGAVSSTIGPKPMRSPLRKRSKAVPFFSSKDASSFNVALLVAKRPNSQPIPTAKITAQKIRTTVNSPPSNGRVIRSASILNSGVAIMKLSAADAGTPCPTRLR